MEPGWGPVAIDLAGLELPSQLPILADHDSSLKGIVGYGTPQAKDGRLLVAGVLAKSEAASAVLALAQTGLKFQASVGVEPIEVRFIEARQAVQVNGRTLQTDKSFRLVSKGRLREVSITAIGADPTTAVTIAAHLQGIAMPQTQQTTTLATPATDTDPIVLERTRVTGIVRAAAKYATGTNAARVRDIEAKALDEGWSIERTENTIFKAALPAPPAPAHGRYTGDGNPAVLTAALMLHAGLSSLAEKTCGAEAAQMAQDLRCHSLLDICAASLRIDGRDAPRERDALIRASFSTMSLPVALGNLAEKSAADAFMETPRVWDRICRRRPVNTFHPHSIVRVLLVGDMEELAPGGEIKHGTMQETVVSAQAKTMALMLSITRTHVVNDDLGVFSDTSNALGKTAARSMNDRFVMCLLDSAAFFTGPLGNLETGVGSALTATTLAAAIANMSSRTDAAGRNLDLRAQTLLTPPELDFAARQILASAEVQRYTSSSKDNLPIANPMFKAVSNFAEPRLSNSRFAGSSATAWYLFSGPQDGAVNLALLGGKDTPTIEQVDLPANVLGIGYRAYIDFGFSLGESLAAYKATGEEDESSSS